jgi:hypothetical protein
MCGKNNDCTCSFTKTLELILMLQQQGEDCEVDNGCSRPFLGPTPSGICLNTRPITLYTCCNNTLWTLPYTLNGTPGESTVFRIENLDDNCATFRVLAPNPDTANTLFPYVATTDFFTINLDCVGVLKCLDDTFVSGI